MDINIPNGRCNQERSIDTATAECDNDSLCKAFKLESGAFNRNCILFTAAPLVPEAGFCSYTKQEQLKGRK